MSRRTFIKVATAAGVSSVLGSQLASCGTASKASFDAVVIGAGVIGCCTARELARYKMSVLVIEGGLDIASGATRANSGIVHTGYDPEPGTLKAKYNVEGAKLFPDWQKELGFAYHQNGALVIAFSEEEMETLRSLQKRAKKNGAPETTILSGWEARNLEPNLSSEVVGALSVPESGVVDPYGLTFAAAENAAENGVEFVFGSKVTEVAKGENGYTVTTGNGQVYEARAVINAAGVYSDEINNMVSEKTLKIKPRRGEYCLYENTVRAFERTIFQAPTENGKGVLVGSAAFGNQFIGPNSVEQKSKDDVSTTYEGLAEVLEKARKTWPEAKADKLIATYAGLRAKNAKTGDFVIGQAKDAPGFFNAACIDSPGLASAPAIAVDLADQVATYLSASPNDSFNPVREGAPMVVMMDDAARADLIKGNAQYGNMVCQCCNVTEGELVAALHRSIPVLSFDALKWRTGATMGPCQSGRCMARILDVVVRELNMKPFEVQKRLEGSNMTVEAEHSAPDSKAVATGKLPDSCNVLVLGSGEAALTAAAKAASALAEAAEQREGADVPTVVLAACQDQVVAGSGFSAPSNLTVCAQSFATSIAGVDDVWAAHDVTLLCPDGVATVRAAIVLLFNGAFEKPRASYAIPGSRPSGVYSAKSMLELLDIPDCLPGSQVVVWGDSPLANECIDKLHDAGVVADHFKTGQIAKIKGQGRVESVLFMAGDLDDAEAVARALADAAGEDVAQESGGSTADQAATDQTAGQAAVGQASGQAAGQAAADQAAAGQTAGQASEEDGETAGSSKVSTRKVMCDTLVVSADMVPDLRLANLIEVKLTDEGFISVDEAGRTSVTGVYAGGAVVAPDFTAEEELSAAETVGEAAAAAAVSLLS